MKLQRSQKAEIWAFGSLVRQINSFQEVLKMKKKKKSQKIKVTGKTPFLVIGPFRT